MQSEISPYRNKTQIFRNNNFDLYTYKSLIVVIEKGKRTVQLDAKINVEIKEAISDAVSYLKQYDLISLPLMFNSVIILVGQNSNEKKLFEQYLSKFNENKRASNLFNFI